MWQIMGMEDRNLKCIVFTAYGLTASNVSRLFSAFFCLRVSIELFCPFTYSFERCREERSMIPVFTNWPTFFIPSFSFTSAASIHSVRTKIFPIVFEEQMRMVTHLTRNA